ncbi:MAG: type III-B CRISPR-associated protein Cas10/Cmr2 [Methylococcales bacterium]
MNKRSFHFTLGPVQSFVAQARRTRDFWAGSFLLSWLSAVAIRAVKAQGGDVRFPIPDDNYLIWLTEGKNNNSQEPQQGCIPNRFKGLVATVPENFKPDDIVKSVQKAWKGLAQEVWKDDLEVHYLAHCKKYGALKTRKIWNRQVRNFWEMSWALTDNETESNLLDRRKNWRSYLPPEEAGVKCMMMDGWQELSGIETPNTQGLDLFWKPLRNNGGSLKTDLREHEYLCAIAFIKRRFSRCFDGFSKEMPNDWIVHGWKVNSSVPSVSYMAAAPWLAEVLKVAPEKELSAFHEVAKVLTQNYYGEYDTRLDCINKALMKREDKGIFWKVKSLDGDVFFDAALDNKNRHEDQIQAQKVKKALCLLRSAANKQLEAHNQPKLEPVSPFYAVLMMDGDSLGSQMSNTDKQEAISRSLNAFTKGVAKVVEEHSGFLIYAGGDDVLALLPLEFALTCAYKLRQLYLDSFEEHGKGKVSSTLSGAIEYAHIKMPLGKVLGDAHHLLDEVAKDQCGRDSIAVRIWKSGGQHLQWAMPWKKAVANDKVIIDELVKDFQKKEQETPFSNSFFFNIEERFGMLQNKNAKGELELAEGFDKKIINKLIAAEYLNSGIDNKNITSAQAEERIAPLITQCTPVKRLFEQGKDGTEDKETFIFLNQLNVDAAHFIRFLVSKGVEHG